MFFYFFLFSFFLIFLFCFSCFFVKKVKLLQNRKDSADSNKVPDRSAVNKIISRTDDEFHLFEKMDKERDERELQFWRDRGNKSDPPPPLMTEDELPAWLQQDFEVPEEASLEYGRGMRSRTDVCYDDNISDSKFTKVIFYYLLFISFSLEFIFVHFLDG